MSEYRFRMKERPDGVTWDLFDRHAPKGGQIVLTGNETDCYRFAVNRDTRQLGLLIQFCSNYDIAERQLDSINPSSAEGELADHVDDHGAQ